MKKIGYHGSQQNLRDEDENYIVRLVTMLEMERESASDYELALLRDIMQKAAKDYRKQRQAVAQ